MATAAGGRDMIEGEAADGVAAEAAAEARVAGILAPPPLGAEILRLLPEESCSRDDGRMRLEASA